MRTERDRILSVVQVYVAHHVIGNDTYRTECGIELLADEVRPLVRSGELIESASLSACPTPHGFEPSRRLRLAPLSFDNTRAP